MLWVLFFGGNFLVIFHQKYRETFGNFFLENFFCLIFGKLCQAFEITKWEKKKHHGYGLSHALNLLVI
jgi:hypothetical protein